jgi:dCMP deaminase
MIEFVVEKEGRNLRSYMTPETYADLKAMGMDPDKEVRDALMEELEHELRIAKQPYKRLVGYAYFNREMPSWDRFFLGEAFYVSGKSKDQSKKCGCVVCSKDNDILVKGWNDIPRDLDDSIQERRERPAKYLWTEHAERNAFYNASRNGTSLKGGTIYITASPCVDCTRGIIQTGISKVVTVLQEDEPEWAERFNIDVSYDMLMEAGREIVVYDHSFRADLEQFIYKGN